MALVRCPECGRQVSRQAETCPGCGHPTFEYCSTEVRNGWNDGPIEGRGKPKLDKLLRQGWEIVGESDSEEKTWQNGKGDDCWIVATTYKLQRFNDPHAREEAERRELMRERLEEEQRSQAAAQKAEQHRKWLASPEYAAQQEKARRDEQARRQREALWVIPKAIGSMLGGGLAIGFVFGVLGWLFAAMGHGAEGWRSGFQLGFWLCIVVGVIWGVIEYQKKLEGKN